MKRKPNGYWSIERILEEGRKYKTRSKFESGCATAYNKARRMGLLDSLNFNPSAGNKFNRCVYVYIFRNFSAYVGITCNLTQRNSFHLKKGSVFNEIIKSGTVPTLIQITDYIPVISSIKMEGEQILKFKNKGYRMLNKAKHGGLGGGVRKWSRENLIKESLKYKTKKEFREQSKGAYIASQRMKIKHTFSHLKGARRLADYWTLEKVQAAASKFKNASDFQKHFPGARTAARRNGWSECFSHFVEKKKASGYWDFKNVSELALKYKKASDFIKEHGGAYGAMKRIGLNTKLQYRIN